MLGILLRGSRSHDLHSSMLPGYVGAKSNEPYCCCVWEGSSVRDLALPHHVLTLVSASSGLRWL